MDPDRDIIWRIEYLLHVLLTLAVSKVVSRDAAHCTLLQLVETGSMCMSCTGVAAQRGQ